MIRFWLIGCTTLVIGCGGDANTGEGTGGAGGFDVCETATCDCDTDADCANHEACDSSAEGSFCVCVASYDDLGSGCEFSGAPLAPGFDDAAPWTTSGGAMLDAAASGFDDPGVVTWVGEKALCDASGVSQAFIMPTYAAAQPLAFELTFSGELDPPVFDAADAMVAFNGKWTRFPATGSFKTARTCLGDVGFGGDVELRVEGAVDRCPSTLELIVDRLEVVRADYALVDCPDPGVVRDGNFDGDGSAWTTIGDATVEEGIGQGGSRAGRLRSQNFCDFAVLRGLASWPLPRTVPNAALRFYWGGTDGALLEVGAGDFDLAKFTGSGTAGTSTVCLPPSSQGLAQTISFGIPRTNGPCDTENVREFTVDTVEVVSAPDCGENPYLVDGDFELGPGGTVTSGWVTFFDAPRGNASIRAGNAQNGSASLRLASRQRCGDVFAQATFVVPEPDANGGPALKYFYRVGKNAQTETSSRPGNGVLPEGSAEFVEETVCLNPALATKPQTLTFTISPVGSKCDETFPEEEAFIDNVRLLTDAACASE